MQILYPGKTGIVVLLIFLCHTAGAQLISDGKNNRFIQRGYYLQGSNTECGYYNSKDSTFSSCERRVMIKVKNPQQFKKNKWCSCAGSTDISYDIRDSSNVPASRRVQYNRFLNNEYSYLPRPRDMWELGVHAGYHFINGDVPAGFGFGGGISLRKSLGHTFSVRAELTGSFDRGLDYRLHPGSNKAWNATSAENNGYYVPNYKTATQQGSIDLIASLSNILFYGSQHKLNWYILGGYSLIVADVDIDALDASGFGYNFSQVNFTARRQEIRHELKRILDGSYEQNAPSQGNRPQIGLYRNNQLMRHAMNIGSGFAFKVSKRFNIGVEEKLTMPFDDYLDGLKQGAGNDFFAYTSIRLNFNLGNSFKRTEPLWWVNPLNYAYNELNRPRHMKLPDPVLPDADGDGITDQFDREPNTPAGVPVDMNGVARDTDGDGVPDYRDKQLITPTYCFPVDADGVGICRTYTSHSG